jgi:hypothetical protein
MVTSKIKQNKKWLVIGVVVLAVGRMSIAQNKTPDYWQCENRVSGSWAFGLAPSGCDARVFGEDQYLFDTYLPVIFNQTTSTTSERGRYMAEMSAALKEASMLYLRKRKPAASTVEQAGFVRATLALAHQESYWTHYRQFTDSKMKMMRGDSGHGHGLMQVDDRWHFVAIDRGVGWNLIDNLVYSLEEYYGAWEKAAKASCVTDASDFRMRARAAYSAYNGGSSKICRWTNPNDKWARNDQGFIDKFDKQLWNQHIKTPLSQTAVNVACLIDGSEQCPLRSTDNSPPRPASERVYQTSQKELCVYHENQFQCISDVRDVTCLQKWAGVTDESIKLMPTDWETSNSRVLLDRHSLCLEKIEVGLHSVGTILKTQRDIQLRATPAGNPLGLVPKGEVLQVFDFEFRLLSEGKRYYQVNWKGQWGFVYGGNIQDFNDWLKPSTEWPKLKWLGRMGDSVKVKRAGGIKLRTSPGGNVLATVPQNHNLVVENVLVSSDFNEVNYQVRFQNQTGFIYSGRSLPDKTFEQWTALIMPSTGQR